MAKAFSHKVRFPVNLPEDDALPQGERTIFVLRPLTLVDDAEIAAALGESASARKPVLYAADCVRHVLDGVQRWPNPAFVSKEETPKELEFLSLERGPDGHVSWETMRYFSLDQLLELYKKLRKAEEIRPREAGN